MVEVNDPAAAFRRGAPEVRAATDALSKAVQTLAACAGGKQRKNVADVKCLTRNS